MNPDDPKLRTALGQAALEGGATLLASRCFEAALALDPADQTARESLDALRKNQPGALAAPRSLNPRLLAPTSSRRTDRGA